MGVKGMAMWLLMRLQLIITARIRQVFHSNVANIRGWLVKLYKLISPHKMQIKTKKTASCRIIRHRLRFLLAAIQRTQTAPRR
jgi:hypothetical protein